MRLHSLQLVNFRQHSDSRLVFDVGLTGIIGPNGSGKTTILEAVAWALYGNTAARGTRESIRFSRAPARAVVRVELDFELAGHRYRIVRGLTNAELYLDGGSHPIANSITGVTELLQRRLGMTRAEFFNTYFTGQKELNVMAAMGPSDRAKFLSRVLGYEKLRIAQDLVREHRRLSAAETAGLRSGMPDRDSIERLLDGARVRMADADARAVEADRRMHGAAAVLEAVQPEWERLQAERDRLQELVADRKVAERDREALARDGQRITRERDEVGDARRELDALRVDLATFAEFAEELQVADGRYREEGRRQALLETAQGAADDLARLRERRTRLESAPAREEAVTLELETTRRTLEEVQGQLEARRTEWVRDRQEAETRLQALRSQFAELRQQRERIVAAGEEGICPTCARPLGGHYRSVLELLEEQAETVRVDGNYFKARLEQLEQMPPEVKALDEQRREITQSVGGLERRLAKVQLAVQELQQVGRDVAMREQRFAALTAEIAAIPSGYEATRHAYLKAEVERLAPLDARAARLSALVEREPLLAREWERVDADRAATEQRLAALVERSERTPFSEAAYAALRERYDAAGGAARGAALAQVAARGDVELARAALRGAEAQRAELDRLQQKLDALERDRRLHDALDRAYSDLRTDLNFALRPDVSDLASGFLSALTDGRYTELELDDQYNIVVLDDGVPKPVISGGEEDLANLVLRLAISQMIAERSGQAFSLLVLDEIFGSLDESHRQHVVDLLRRLRDRFEQVILITHIESVREGLDRVIAVRYDEDRGTSVVEQADGDAVAFDGDPGVAPMVETPAA